VSQVCRKIKGAISTMRILIFPPHLLAVIPVSLSSPSPLPRGASADTSTFRSPIFSSMSVEPSSDDILNTGSTPLQDRTNTRFETELAEKEEEIARLTGLVKG
jgi:hypothetical protein